MKKKMPIILIIMSILLIIVGVLFLFMSNEQKENPKTPLPSSTPKPTEIPTVVISSNYNCINSEEKNFSSEEDGVLVQFNIKTEYRFGAGESEIKEGELINILTFENEEFFDRHTHAPNQQNVTVEEDRNTLTKKSRMWLILNSAYSQGENFTVENYIKSLEKEGYSCTPIE